jgi:hypothetical protein
MLKSSLHIRAVWVAAFVGALVGCGDAVGAEGEDGGRGDSAGSSTGSSSDPGEIPTERLSVDSPNKVFDNAGNYEGKAPPFRAESKHAFMKDGLASKRCMDCHEGSGPGPRFAFAGRVYKGEGERGADGAPTIRQRGAARTEMRVVGADGLVFDTTSDADGYFWFKTPADVKTPAFSGARSSRGRAFGRLNGTSCYDCHDVDKAGGPGRIWIW